MREAEIDNYIYQVIVPKYAAFDAAHKEDHAHTVIDQSMRLLDSMQQWLKNQESVDKQWLVSVDRQMLKMAAACHDLGLANGRDRHHLDSGTIIRNDADLRRWFSEDEIEMIAQAAEDHRASNRQGPRTIYGSILAEADRVIDPHKIIRRTIQYGISNYPELDMEGHWERTVEHLLEKYAEGGYLRLWIPESPNAARLEELRSIIRDRTQLRNIFDRIFTEEC